MLNARQKPIPDTDAFGFTERNRKTIQVIWERFVSVKDVILFGSRAVGTHRPNSDVDVCIMNEDFNQQEYSSIVAAFEECDLPYFTDVLVFHRQQNEALKETIRSNGRLIYNRAL